MKRVSAREQVQASNVRRSVVWTALITMVPLAGLFSLLVGTSALPLSEVVSVLGGGGSPLARAVLLEARLPVALHAVIVGACLGTAGAAMQGLLRNPLADPYILGISGGAGVGVAGAMLLSSSILLGQAPLPLAAGVGAALALVLLLVLARRMPGGIAGGTTSLLLAGVMLNAFAGSVLLLAHLALAPGQSQRLLFWLMGSLSQHTLSPSDVLALWIPGLVGVALLIWRAQRLNLLGLGVSVARTLGVRWEVERVWLVAGTALAVATAVAYAGLIGFVGLLIPHVARALVGPDHRRLLPASALLGASALLVADSLGRYAFQLWGSMVPAGAVTALVGAPLFLWMLIRGSAQLRGAR